MYIADIIVLRSPHPDQHGMRHHSHQCFYAPVLWPHNGTHTGDIKGGLRIRLARSQLELDERRDGFGLSATLASRRASLQTGLERINIPS